MRPRPHQEVFKKNNLRKNGSRSSRLELFNCTKNLKSFNCSIILV